MIRRASIAMTASPAAMLVLQHLAIRLLIVAHLREGQNRFSPPVATQNTQQQTKAAPSMILAHYESRARLMRVLQLIMSHVKGWLIR